MIFEWEKEFDEDLVLKGIDLEDNVNYLDRSINFVSGCIQENDNEYWVYIELDDDFKIKSLECDCGESKCHHMAALLHAENFKFSQDIEYEDLVDDLDNQKLIKFIKNQVTYNDECREDFIDEFRTDFLNDEEFSLEYKLFLILDYYDWHGLITEFIKKDLIKLYDDGYYSETFYLISAMFKKVIGDLTYNPETELEECYSLLVDLIKKLSKTKPGLIKEFLKYCINHNYLQIYPVFRKLVNELNM